MSNAGETINPQQPFGSPERVGGDVAVVTSRNSDGAVTGPQGLDRGGAAGTGEALGAGGLFFRPAPVVGSSGAVAIDAQSAGAGDGTYYARGQGKLGHIYSNSSGSTASGVERPAGAVSRGLGRVGTVLSAAPMGGGGTLGSSILPLQAGSPARDAGEVFGSRVGGAKAVTRFQPVGRFGRSAAPFTSDLSVGKFGVLGVAEAMSLEQKLLFTFAHDDLNMGGRSDAFRLEFLRALHLFLAINSGSIGNVTGRMGVRDDSQPLQFADAEVSAADVAAVLGDRAYAYMRARATEIRDTIESAFATANLPQAEVQFPGVCRAVELIRAVAAMKGISQYPQYVAVGSQYAAGTPPYLVALLQDSASKVLSSTSGNVRESHVPGN